MVPTPRSGRQQRSGTWRTGISTAGPGVRHQGRSRQLNWQWRARTGRETSARLGAPEFHRAVVAAGGQRLAVGTELNVVDRSAMPAQRDQFGAGVEVPDADVAVGPARCQSLAVRVERHAEDRALVADEPA